MFVRTSYWYFKNAVDNFFINSLNENKLKDRIWKVDLETNKFIMFPATLQYFVENKNNSHLNYIQTLTFVDTNRLYL